MREIDHIHPMICEYCEPDGDSVGEHERIGPVDVELKVLR